MSLRSALVKPATLWACFVVMLISYAAIAACMLYWEMELLDGKILPDDTFYTVSCYTIGKKEVHIWITSVLDVIFPVSANALFAGLIWKGFSARFQWLLLLPLIALGSDMVEGMVQLIMLQRSFIVMPEGQQSLLLMAKAVLTSIKFATYLAAIALAVSALFRMTRRSPPLDAGD